MLAQDTILSSVATGYVYFIVGCSLAAPLLVS